MKQPKVSIIIPVYNGSHYLKEAIDSALAQKYQNLEVIVINDGSNDGSKTERIIKSYGKKVRYFFKKNEGTASALNLGIKKMKGEWFSWLSHDDVYFKDKISKQIAFIKKHPKARFIYSQHISIDENGKQLKRGFHDWLANPQIPQIRQLLKSNHISGCTTLIHQSCFEKVGLFNTDNKTAQDYEMWLVMSAYFKFYRCPEIVLKRRIHKEMGNIVFAKQNQKDVRTAIRNADVQLTIKQIFPDKLTKTSNQKSIFKYHRKLADFYLLNHGLVDLAKKHYQLAWENKGKGNYFISLRIFAGQTIYSFKKLFKSLYNLIAWQIIYLLAKSDKTQRLK